MRILHVLSQLPDRTGSGIYLRSLVRQGAARGHRQHVLAAANEDQPAQLDPDQVEQLELVRFNTPRLPFALPGMSDVMPYPSSVWSTLGDTQLAQYRAEFRAALERARQRLDPQLVHVNHLWQVAALARQVFEDRPVVASCHGTDLRQVELCPELARQVIPPCARADGVLALTEQQRQRVSALYGVDPARITVTGAAVNTELFHPPPPPAAPRPARGVVYVGKLSAAKGVPSLLDAVELLRDQGQELSLELVGSGSGAETEAICARARKLAPAVRLRGHLGQPAVAELLRSSSVFVLPSFYEGLPLVVAEALACGCRVVVSDLPAMQGWPPPELVPLELLQRVALPPLSGVDRPRPEGLPAFASRLAAALRQQLERAADPGAASETRVCAERVTSALGWAAMFGRIEAFYERAIKAAAATR